MAVRQGDAEAESAGGRYVESLERALGIPVLRLFDDPDVTEIQVNPDGRVWVDTHSVGRKATELTLPGRKAEAFLKRVATEVGETLTEEQHQLQAELPVQRFMGARLQGGLPPCALGPFFALRKRPDRVYSLEDYRARGGASEWAVKAIEYGIARDLNIAISGGTGTGKTTLLNAILLAKTRLRPDSRYVVIEEVREVQCAAPNVVQLRTTKHVGMRELLRSTLRLTPDYIIVGEVRGAEALTMLDANSTGHPGGICTVHAESPEKALRRLNRLAMQANVPDQSELVADGVNLVVQIDRFAAGRRITRVAEVKGYGSGGFVIESFAA
ncbi:MAG: ATPase, T2SS/T4P/T4SS family [Gemmatimonadota bacterium]